MSAASKVTFGRMEADVACGGYADITVGGILVGWVGKFVASEDGESLEHYTLWLEVDELRAAGLGLNNDTASLWRPYASLDGQGNGSVSRTFWVCHTAELGPEGLIEGTATKAFKEAKEFARQIIGT